YPCLAIHILLTVAVQSIAGVFGLDASQWHEDEVAVALVGGAGDDAVAQDLGFGVGGDQLRQVEGADGGGGFVELIGAAYALDGVDSGRGNLQAEGGGDEIFVRGFEREFEGALILGGGYGCAVAYGLDSGFFQSRDGCRD